MNLFETINAAVNALAAWSLHRQIIAAMAVINAIAAITLAIKANRLADRAIAFEVARSARSERRAALLAQVSAASRMGESCPVPCRPCAISASTASGPMDSKCLSLSGESDMTDPGGEVAIPGSSHGDVAAPAAVGA